MKPKTKVTLKCPSCKELNGKHKDNCKMFRPCGKEFMWIESMNDKRICGRIEDLKHSDNILLCPECQKLNSLEIASDKSEATRSHDSFQGTNSLETNHKSKLTTDGNQDTNSLGKETSAVVSVKAPSLETQDTNSLQPIISGEKGLNRNQHEDTIINEILQYWVELKRKELDKEGIKGQEKHDRLNPSKATRKTILRALQKGKELAETDFETNAKNRSNNFKRMEKYNLS
jgi:phage FluMu protein Com